MLLLTRKLQERLVIDGNIVLEVLEVQGNRVRFGITAPSEVTILRKEVLTGEKGDPVSPTSRGGTLVAAS